MEKVQKQGRQTVCCQVPPPIHSTKQDKSLHFTQNFNRVGLKSIPLNLLTAISATTLLSEILRKNVLAALTSHLTYLLKTKGGKKTFKLRRSIIHCGASLDPHCHHCTEGLARGPQTVLTGLKDGLSVYSSLYRVAWAKRQRPLIYT